MTHSISQGQVALDALGTLFRNEVTNDHVTARRVSIFIGAALLAAGFAAAAAAAEREKPIEPAADGSQAALGAKIWDEPKRTRALFLFWPQYESWWGDHAAFRQKRRHTHAHPKPEPMERSQPQDAPKGALQIVISVADQRISLYDNGTLMARSSVSTGVRGHPTPLGVFSVIGKQRWHRSNIYSGAPMPYMQRITWSGVALHEGILPGHPASHGCIRLTKDFAIRLWHLTKRGTRVIIARDDVRPVEVANPHLFVSKPKAASASPESAVAGADNGTITLAATQAQIVSTAETQDASTLNVQGSAPVEAGSQNIVPISIFVSRKLSKLFIRQGFRPVLNVPIKIERPEEPLGTHVFTIMEPQTKDAPVRWTVISMPAEFAGATGSSNKEATAPRARSVERAPAEQTPDSANAALDRIEIPEDVVTQISELLAPGSSLIISDYGMSHETGRDTDFIVITH